MEKPKNIREELGDIFADRNIPRVVIENDIGTGDKIEVINHGGEILTRVENTGSTTYRINGKDLATI